MTRTSIDFGRPSFRQLLRLSLGVQRHSSSQAETTNPLQADSALEPNAEKCFSVLDIPEQTITPETGVQQHQVVGFQMWNQPPSNGDLAVGTRRSS